MGSCPDTDVDPSYFIAMLCDCPQDVVDVSEWHWFLLFAQVLSRNTLTLC